MFEALSNFLKKKCEIQNIILDYLDDCDDNDTKLKQKKLFEFINQSQLLKNTFQLEDFLLMLSTLSNNHERNSKNKLIIKIQEILLNYKDEIHSHLNDNQIFKIFKDNNRIILFLINNSFFEIKNDLIFNHLYSFESSIAYFYPELREINRVKFENAVKDYHLQEFIEESDSNFDEFLQNRDIGENENIVAKMARNDSINELITYSEQTNFNFVKFTLQRSIFETNLFLRKTHFPTFINYASFFGSIQIVKYLITKGIPLTSNAWLYAIHGRNYEIIHLLEDQNISENQFKCFDMTIKCHHNEIAEYLLNKLENNKNKIIESFLTCIKERNFHVALEIMNNFPNFFNEKMDFNDQSKVFFSFIQNKYDEIVKVFINFNNSLINAQDSIFFLIILNLNEVLN